MADLCQHPGLDRSRDKSLSGLFRRRAFFDGICHNDTGHIVLGAPVDWPALHQVVKGFIWPFDGLGCPISNTHINRRYPLHTVASLLDIHSCLHAIFRRYRRILPKSSFLKRHDLASIVTSVDGPKTLAPCAEAIIKHVIEIRAAEGGEIVERRLTSFTKYLGFPLIAERGGKTFHDGLRTEARAQASPSRQEIGDAPYVEQMSGKETPAPPETTNATLVNPTTIRDKGAHKENNRAFQAFAGSVALALIDGPKTLEPSPEPIIENISEIGTGEGVKPVEGGLASLLDNSGSSLIAEHGGITFHVGLRTEARAHASPSRREVGDEAHVEQMPEKETPASPETKGEAS